MNYGEWFPIDIIVVKWLEVFNESFKDTENSF